MDPDPAPVARGGDQDGDVCYLGEYEKRLASLAAVRSALAKVFSSHSQAITTRHPSLRSALIFLSSRAVVAVNFESQ